MADTEQKEEPPYVDGFVKEGFEKVRDVFRANLENGTDKGSGFAAYFEGELVVNIWGGWVEKEAGQKWREDTMPCFFSATKSPSALVIAHLVDRGLLDYSEKISKYWPAFGQNGKEDITLETYMTNKAGLSGVEEVFSIMLLLEDPEKLGEILAKQKPLWEPGTKHGYHPLTFAMYLDQIVRKVDPQGRSLSQYFDEEIAKPFDIEFHIGLPKEKFYRAPRIVNLFDFTPEDMMKELTGGDPEVIKVALGTAPDFMGAMNNPYVREVPLGSALGHGTVAAMAKFHSILANGGVQNGKRLLSEEAIKRQMIPRTAGKDASFGMDMMFSLGTMVYPSADDHNPPVYGFGHGGYGGQNAMADPTYRVGLAYGTNYMNPFMSDIPKREKRAEQLAEALYECVYKIKNISAKRKTFLTYTLLKEYQDSLAS